MKKLLVNTYSILICAASYAQLPAITSFSPASGAIGSSVTIVGAGFNAAANQNVVFFGATQATVVAASTTSLSVIVPVGATFQYLSVTNLAVNLTAYSAKPFIVTLAGHIAFLPKQDFATGAAGTQSLTVSVGDLDGDGKSDLAVINLWRSMVSVFHNTSAIGTVSFASKVDFSTDANASSVFFGDIDGDGKPDLVVTNDVSNSLSVLLNTSSSGSISFASKIDFTTGSDPISVSIGDIDGDGKLDLAIANHSSNSISVLRNTSNSGIINFAAKVDFTTGSSPYSLCIGDLDGDGKPDLSIANSNSNTVSLLRNTSSIGSISFASKIDFTTGAYPTSVSIGDIDGDGKPDLAVVNYNSTNTVSLFHNISSVGAISFAGKVDFATAVYPYSASIGDIDGDGKPDLAVAAEGGMASVFRNTSILGTISFTSRIDFIAGTSPISLSIGDVDGDGRPDLAVADYNNNTVSILQQTPAPTITSFSPTSGDPGTLVTITGTNLGSTTAFTIGGTTAIVVSNDGTTLVGLVMPGSSTGTVSVTTAGGSATGSGSFTVTPTPYPSLQQGNKLVGTGAIGSASQGYSIAISSDGSTAIVGGVDDNSSIGAAWVYKRSSGVWSQQGNKLVGSGAILLNGTVQQGISVGISADGNTVIIGGPIDSLNTGAAWVFIRSAGIWTQQGNKLIGSGGAGYNQGHSVSLSADGNTALIGGWGDNSGIGAAWVFNRLGGIWTQQGNKLVGTGAVGASRQGQSVSLSADGNTAIVGGNRDNSNAGAAWIYTYTAGTWTQQGSKLVGLGATSNANQGQSVSLSADGNTAIVGGPGDNVNTGDYSGLGAVWVYTRLGGVWTPQGNKIVGTGALGWAMQGTSVSLSADGNTAVVGGPADNTNAGAAWVFTRSGVVWTQQGNKLVGTAATTGYVDQGCSISLSADGSTAIVGGFGDNGNAGAAWVFVPCTSVTIASIANQTTSANVNLCSAIVNYATPTTTGSPAPDITYSFSGATTGSGNGTGSGTTFSTGITTVTLTATNTCAADTSSFTVTVADTAAPTITAPATVNATINAGCTANGVALGTPATADNCMVDNVSNDAPTAFPLGNTTVTWTVTDGSGNTKTASQTVIVTDTIKPTIAAPANVTVCNGTTISLGTPVTADNCTVASVNNNAPGTYPVGTTNVVWTVTDGSGNTASSSQTITVSSSPDMTTAVSGVSITANQAGAVYKWLNCNTGYSIIAGATNQTYTAAVNGTYAVLVKIGNCSDTSACVSISNVGINESDLKAQFIIYPNPFTWQTTISFSEEQKNTTIKIMDVLGKEVKTVVLNGAKNLTIERSDMKAGIYFVQVIVENKNVVNKKIVVE